MSSPSVTPFSDTKPSPPAKKTLHLSKQPQILILHTEIVHPPHSLPCKETPAHLITKVTQLESTLFSCADRTAFFLSIAHFCNKHKNVWYQLLTILSLYILHCYYDICLFIICLYIICIIIYISYKQDLKSWYYNRPQIIHSHWVICKPHSHMRTRSPPSD